MYECDVWNFPAMLSGLRFQNDWRTRMEFYGHALSRHRLTLKDSVNGLEKVRTPEDLYRVFAEMKDARFYGEKSPFYCDRLGQLAQNHPGSSFILIWRNPVEIFQSIEYAANNSYYFRRHGMLSRLIFYYEQMIYEAARLVRAGHRVHHVTYADLTDRTEESCRGMCRFLEIEFDSKMLDLSGADLSAVFRAPQFEHLRRGKITRRQLPYTGTHPRVVEKLKRFHNRWNRLGNELLNLQNNSVDGPEPGLHERFYHHRAGSLLCGLDGAIRAGFEFLPLPWLRTYRQAKIWFKAGRAASLTDRRSAWDELTNNKATILLSTVILALIAIADYATGFAVSLMPFYLIPAAIMTLVINKRWGTMAAVASCLAWAGIQILENPYVNPSHPGIWLWDIFMRFCVTEIVVLLLERIRIEIRAKKPLSD